MRAVILAAGSGMRMGKYGEDLPKCMLPINGKPIIEWQIERLKGIGLSDITIITGYKAETIKFAGVAYYHNADYAETNMIETLMCAREALDTDVLISYGDILFTKELAQKTADCPADIGVAADSAWRDYWLLRYGSTEVDLETLSLSADGRINEIGKPVSSSDGINLRYIGLLKFSKKGLNTVLRLYDDKKTRDEFWKQSGKPFKKGYMTDMLHELIMAGVSVHPVITKGGWLEFDTVRDYEMAPEILNTSESSRLLA
jgi:L-glutamine-phosphate cytidylyltransferase